MDNQFNGMGNGMGNGNYPTQPTPSNGYGAPPPSYYPTAQPMQQQPQPYGVPQPMQQVPQPMQQVPQPYASPLPTGAPNGQNLPPQGPVNPGYPGNPMYQPIDKRILKQCRHKAEARWYRRLVALNVALVVAAVAFFVYSFDDTRQYAEDIGNSIAEEWEAIQNPEEDDGESANNGKSANNDKSTDSQSKDEKSEEEELDTIQDKAKEIPDSLYYLLEIVLTLIAIPFVVCYAYAQYRSMSVRITEKTYPEIYAIVQEYAQKLGMKKVPNIYMVQGNGVLNAFSTFIPFKQYIEVYADLLEVAYREHHDMDTIRFIIAHEMGHIYYKHATMHYYYAIMFSQLIPILGSTASRTREYSCDRLAQLLSGSDGVDAMMSLTAGIHLYKQVDKQDYIEHARTVKGFFVFCYNLVCDHPITTKRVLALVDPERKSGQLY